MFIIRHISRRYRCPFLMGRYTWFIDFMDRARNLLRERLCAKVVVDPFLIAEFLEAAFGVLDAYRPSSAFLDLSVFIGEHSVVKVENTLPM